MSQVDKVLSDAAELSYDDKLRVIRELSSQLDSEIERIVASDPEIPGQVSGYWLRSPDDMPGTSPPYEPTGAVLPVAGALADGGDCLDLVQLDDGGWFPLSEAGLYTYAHSGSLAYGDDYYFAPRSPWGSIYLAALGTPVDRDGLARLSDVAFQRARPDRKLVVITLRRLDARP